MKVRLTLLLLVLSTVCYAQNSRQEALLSAIKGNDQSLIISVLKLDSGSINAPIFEDRFLSDVKHYPIHVALQYSNQQTIGYLLQLGANPLNNRYSSALLSGKEKSSLEILVEYRDLEMLKRFVFQLQPTAQAYTRALQWAAENGAHDKVKYLLSQGERLLLGS